MNKLIFLSLLVLLLSPLFTGFVGSNPSTSMYVSPASKTVNVGATFSVDVDVADVVNATCWQFTLDFGTAVLQCTKATEGPFLKSGGGTTFKVFTRDNTNGVLIVYCYLSLLNVSASGSGVLATVTFNATAAGQSALHLRDTLLGDTDIPPHNIPHSLSDGTVTVQAPGQNLIIDDILVDNKGCTVYANDTYANETAYYVPVNITVENAGDLDAGSFNVSLTVYWINGSLQEDYVEWRVSGLNLGENTTLTYSWHPMHTGSYNLTASADCHNELWESDEGDNTVAMSDYPVALMGDLNGNHQVNIQDIGFIGLSWHSHPGDWNWNLRADLNHDDYVDIEDIVRVTLRWHQTW